VSTLLAAAPVDQFESGGHSRCRDIERAAQPDPPDPQGTRDPCLRSRFHVESDTGEADLDLSDAGRGQRQVVVAALLRS